MIKDGTVEEQSAKFELVEEERARPITSAKGELEGGGKEDSVVEEVTE